MANFSRNGAMCNCVLCIVHETIIRYARPSRHTCSSVQQRNVVKLLFEVSEDPSLKEEMEKEVGSTNPAAAAAGWANWAVGAVTAKFYKSR